MKAAIPKSLGASGGASHLAAFAVYVRKTFNAKILNNGFFDRRYRTIVFIASFIAHIPFLFGRYLPRESLKYFSADENALIRVILKYQEHISRGDLASLLTEQLYYGYGYFFYLSYSILTYPFAALAGDEGVLAVGRLISAFLEGGTIVLVCMIVRRLGVHAYVVVLMGAAMAFTPGLIVMHKPLSAEQLSNFLIVLAAYVAFAMPLRSFRGNLFLISVLAVGAISVKFNAALQGLFFAIVVLTRMYQERNALLSAGQQLGEKFRTIIADVAVLAAGFFTFFLWNLPIAISGRSRGDFFNWLVIQFESNQNSQRGKVNYRGIQEWWPKIDAYFGDNVVLPWLLLSAGAAGIIGLFLKNGKNVAFYSFIGLVWIVVPAAYVILTVKKIWLWYLVLPGFCLLLGPTCLYAAGQRLHEAGARLRGTLGEAFSVSLLIAHLWAVVPDYAAFASERWRETERPDFVEMEAMRAAMTREVAGKLDQTSMIVDQRVTLPVDAWRTAGADISVRYLPDVSEEFITDMKPGYIIIRLWGYAHHRGNRQQALAEFQAKLDRVCAEADLCYQQSAQYELSKTLVYKLKS